MLHNWPSAMTMDSTFKWMMIDHRCIVVNPMAYIIILGYTYYREHYMSMFTIVKIMFFIMIMMIIWLFFTAYMYAFSCR